jgi:hypothetical protein
MGTRSLTTFIQTYKSEKTGQRKTNKIVAMYRQYDGYPEGHGLELCKYLAGGDLVNGIGLGKNERMIFNGMGCLAASVVSHFKDGPGNIYLEAPRKMDWENYEYKVIGDFDTHELSVHVVTRGYMSKKGDYINKNKTLFKGSPKQVIEWINKK